MGRHIHLRGQVFEWRQRFFPWMTQTSWILSTVPKISLVPCHECCAASHRSPLQDWRSLFRNYPEQSNLTQGYAFFPGQLSSKTTQHWPTKHSHLIILTENNSEGPSQLQGSPWGELKPSDFKLAEFSPYLVHSPFLPLIGIDPKSLP